MKTIISFIALMIMPALLLSGCEKEVVKKEVIRPVKATRVSGQLETLTGRTFPGKATATQEVNLSFRISGRLIEFPAQVGDRVKKGDLLARLDPRDYQVELRNVEGQLKRTQAALELAQSDYTRVVRIRQKDPGAISQAMIDAKKGDLDSSRAQVQSLRATVAGARDNLSYTYLRAPFAGTVVETFVENFEDVQAKQAIVRLVDTAKIEFTVSIPENLISMAESVEKTFVRFDAFPDKDISARIKEIGKEASKTTRTYPVTLIMEQPEGIEILPGMAGKAWADRVSQDLLPGTVEGLPVPVAATFTDAGKSYLWLIDEQTMTVHRQEVQLGRISNEGVIIREGLKGGELIVTAGVHSLTEGQKVRLFE